MHHRIFFVSCRRQKSIECVIEGDNLIRVTFYTLRLDTSARPNDYCGQHVNPLTVKVRQVEVMLKWSP